MSDWKAFRLDDITFPIKEVFLPKGDSNLAYIGLEHIEQETLRLNSVGVSSDVTSQKFMFRKNDILFGKLRPYFRKVIKPQFDGICSTDIWVFRAKNNIDQNFLFYLLASWDFVNTANTGESGTRMPRADWNFLKNTEWLLPPLKEQKAIAEVLSSLDDKIDLLHRNNKTLEQMAETLFRMIFDDELMAGEGDDCLGEFVQVNRGLSYKGSGLTTADDSTAIPMINLNSVFEGGGYKEKGIKFYNGEYKDRHEVFPGDVVVANTEQGHKHLLIGCPAIVQSSVGLKAIFSQHIYRVVPRDNSFPAPFLYYLLKHPQIRDQVIGATNGSTVNMLPADGIERVKFNAPAKEKILEFNCFVSDLLSKAERNNNEIRTLTNMRNLLLPNLISGKVIVK